jgi:hypothetical protein
MPDGSVALRAFVLGRNRKALRRRMEPEEPPELHTQLAIRFVVGVLISMKPLKKDS